MRSHESIREQREELVVLSILYELPDDDSLGIEKYSNVGCHLLK